MEGPQRLVWGSICGKGRSWSTLSQRLKYENKVLLQIIPYFSVRGNQEAINKSLFEVPCDHNNFR